MQIGTRGRRRETGGRGEMGEWRRGRAREREGNLIPAVIYNSRHLWDSICTLTL